MKQIWKQVRRKRKNPLIICPMCGDKFTHDELVKHYAKSHRRSLQQLSRDSQAYRSLRMSNAALIQRLEGRRNRFITFPELKRMAMAVARKGGVR